MVVTGLAEYVAKLELPAALATTRVMLYWVPHVRPAESVWGSTCSTDKHTTEESCSGEACKEASGAQHSGGKSAPEICTHPRDAAGADGSAAADGRGTEVELGEVCAVGCAAVSVKHPARTTPSLI